MENGSSTFPSLFLIATSHSTSSSPLQIAGPRELCVGRVHHFTFIRHVSHHLHRHLSSSSSRHLIMMYHACTKRLVWYGRPDCDDGNAPAGETGVAVRQRQGKKSMSAATRSYARTTCGRWLAQTNVPPAKVECTLCDETSRKAATAVLFEPHRSRQSRPRLVCWRGSCRYGNAANGNTRSERANTRQGTHTMDRQM